MNIREMHIAIDVLLQKINSNSRRDILEEEKDLILNWSIQQYVSSKIKKSNHSGDAGLYNDEIDASAISSLIETYYPVNIFRSVDEAEIVIDAAYFPNNLRNFISASFLGLPASCVPSLMYRKVDKTSYLYTLKIFPGMGGANDKGRYFSHIEFTYKGTMFTIESDGTSDPDFTRFVYLAVENRLKQEGIFLTDLSWQSNQSDIDRVSALLWRSSEELPSGNTNIRVGQAYLEPVKIVRTVKENVIEGMDTTRIIGRRIKPQFIEEVENGIYSRSSGNKVNFLTANSKLVISHGGRLILTKAVINYVRKPAEVNLSLGINCDLPDDGDVHETICREAVAEMLLVIDSPNWQARFETNKLDK